MRNLIIAFLFFLPSLAFSQSFKTESGEAIFLSKAPLNEFTGESEKLKGLIDLEKNLVDFYLDLTRPSLLGRYLSLPTISSLQKQCLA